MPSRNGPARGTALTVVRNHRELTLSVKLAKDLLRWDERFPGSRLEFLGNCPYGYRLAADRKHIEPDRAEQAVLKRIRKLRADGLSLQAVAVELNRRKLTTRQGSPWRMEYVARIEKREASGAIAPLR